MKKITAVKGDITQMDVEAIVNAANTSLLGGGGVDGAIHRAAGPELLLYNKTLGGCKTGEAKVSPGFKLKAHYVISTVGPVWQGGSQGEEALLSNCYTNSLKRAVEMDCRSLAFPSISTGVYGYPLELAAPVAIRAVRVFFAEYPECKVKVYFVCFDDAAYKVYQNLLSKDADFETGENFK